MTQQRAVHCICEHKNHLKVMHKNTNASDSLSASTGLVLTSVPLHNGLSQFLRTDTAKKTLKVAAFGAVLDAGNKNHLTSDRWRAVLLSSPYVLQMFPASFREEKLKLMSSCKHIYTFEDVDELFWCYTHSETSLWLHDEPEISFLLQPPSSERNNVTYYRLTVRLRKGGGGQRIRRCC